MTTTTKLGPVEVWLTQRNMTIECRVVHDDETVDELELNSLSMRGAQREITGYLIREGYTPTALRWTVVTDGEASRQFKPAATS